MPAQHGVSSGKQLVNNMREQRHRGSMCAAKSKKKKKKKGESVTRSYASACVTRLRYAQAADAHRTRRTPLTRDNTLAGVRERARRIS